MDSHDRDKVIALLKSVGAECDVPRRGNTDHAWRRCRHCLALAELDHRDIRGLLRSLMAELESALAAPSVVPPPEPLINTKTDVERACRLDPKGERDYLSYAIGHLQAARDKREDAPCSSSEHEMGAKVALLLERVPTYPEIVAQWKREDEAERAAPSVVPPEWQPIETAPRDGKSILLWWPGESNRAVVGSWHHRAEWTRPGHWYSDVTNCTTESSPTLWMPLPEPPNEAGRVEPSISPNTAEEQ